MAEAVTGNAFLDGLLERAPVGPSQPRRGQNYNYPERLYLLPDGRVERLQGDPHNRAYYEDKGYRLLSDLPGRDGRKSEVRQYLENEHPTLLVEQREKALIINSIRRACERDATLGSVPQDYDDYTLDELREELQNIKEQYGKNIPIIKTKKRRETMSPEDRLLSGVETTEQTSIEHLEQRRRQPPSRRGEPAHA
jgi:hypothetical protein